MIFILWLSDISFTKSKALRFKKLSHDSKVTLTLKGGQKQKILYSDFQPLLYKLEINGSIQDPPNIIVDLPETNEEYAITMTFNNSVNSTYNMFSNLNSNIIKIDLSNFDFSQVTDMRFMFNSCKNVEYINFGNIKHLFSQLYERFISGLLKIIICKFIMF